MPTRVMSDIQVIAAGGNYDAQPAAGVEWVVTMIGCNTWVGVAPAAVPQLNVGIFDGALGPAWLMRSVDVRGWNRKLEIHINNANYMRLNNPGGAGVNASFIARQSRSFGTANTVVITDLQTVAAAGTYDLQPPVGQEYLITDVGSTMWIGGAPNGLPDVTVSIFDGTNAAAVMMGANVRNWNKTLDLHINNTNYLRFTNTNAAQAVIAMVGYVSRNFGTAASLVQTDVQVIGAGANWDFQPAVPDEYKVTDFGAGTWVGVAPGALPQITVDLFDGTNASRLLQSTDDKGWHDPIEIIIDNTNYLRINDASGAGQNIAVSAVQTREFAP